MTDPELGALDGEGSRALHGVGRDTPEPARKQIDAIRPYLPQAD